VQGAIGDDRPYRDSYLKPHHSLPWGVDLVGKGKRIFIERSARIRSKNVER